MTARHVVNTHSFSMHRARMALSQVKALLRARPGNGILSISPMSAQARRRFAQVIHMVVHSKAGNTFSWPAGRQQRASVPVLARGGRHAGRGSGLGLVDSVRDGAGAGARAQAARAPRRLPAVTLIVILPAARPRYAQPARAQSPPELVPPACATTTRSRSVGRRPPSTTGFSRRSPASNGRRRGAGPGGVSLPSRTLDNAGRRQAGRQHYRDAPRKLAARSPITTRSLAWPRVITAPRPPRSPARTIQDLRPSDPSDPAGQTLLARRGTQPCGPALRPSCTGLLPTRRLPRSLPPGRGRPRTRPCCVLTPDRRGWHSGVAGVPALAKTFLPGRIRQGPSMYEMEGPCPASPRLLASCLVFAAPRAARRGQVPARGPVSRLLPRSRGRPRVVPVSSGESISTASATTAQGPAASHFLFFRYPRRNPQKASSYPHFTAVIHGFIHSLPTGYRVEAGEHLNRVHSGVLGVECVMRRVARGA